jgi:hypothetical protein
MFNDFNDKVVLIKSPEAIHTGFTLIPNNLLRDRKISTNARFLLSFCLSYSDYFTLSASTIRQSLGWGADKLVKVLKELKQYQYLQIIPIRDKGRFAGSQWVINPFGGRPKAEDSMGENTVVDTTVETPPRDYQEGVLLSRHNKDYNNKEYNNKEYKNKEKKNKEKKNIEDVETPSSLVDFAETASSTESIRTVKSSDGKFFETDDDVILGEVVDENNQPFTQPPSNKISKKKDPTLEFIGKSIFKYWQEKCGHLRTIYSPDKKAKIEARLKEGHSPEDCILAIDGILLSPHHQGQNDRNTVYDDFTLIFRNASYLEKFRDLALVPTKQGEKTNETTTTTRYQSYAKQQAERAIQSVRDAQEARDLFGGRSKNGATPRFDRDY